AAALDELVAKPALARPRLGDHAYDLRVPRNRLLESSLQSGHLALAPDELGEAARAGHVETGPYAAHALELEDVHWIARSPDPSFAKISERKVARNQLRGVFREIDRVGCRDLLHARGKADRMALRRVVHPEVVADLSDDDLAGIEAHSDGEVEAALEAKLV